MLTRPRATRSSESNSATLHQTQGDSQGFPLMVCEFEGNQAETTTMIPTITEFMTAHALRDVVVVADAGMISESNRHAITDAGLSYIIGEKMPQIPYVLEQWIQQHPGAEPADGMVLMQTWPTTEALAAAGRRGRVVYYVYSAQRGARTRHGIDQQVDKAAAMVAGSGKIARNRFVSLTGGKRSVNTDLEAKARTLADWKAYTTNIPDPTPEFVIASYKRLLNVEHGTAARPGDRL